MILDTNALSDIFKETDTIKVHVENAGQLYVPAIVLGEYLFGLKNSTMAEALTTLLTDFMDTVQELSIGSITALHYADIRWELKSNGTPIPGNDIWIAALAREYTFPILSRDSHFDYIKGISRITW